MWWNVLDLDSTLPGLSFVNILEPFLVRNVSFVLFNTKCEVTLLTFLSRRQFSFALVTVYFCAWIYAHVPMILLWSCRWNVLEVWTVV